jgi:hypothetical protein
VTRARGEGNKIFRGSSGSDSRATVPEGLGFYEAMYEAMQNLWSEHFCVHAAETQSRRMG